MLGGSGSALRTAKVSSVSPWKPLKTGMSWAPEPSKGEKVEVAGSQTPSSTSISVTA